MNIARLFAICALIVLPSLVTGCVSSDVGDIRVQAESNPKIDLDGYRTYSWFAAAAVVRDPDAEWTPPDLEVAAEIRRLVDHQLQEAGKAEVGTSPDMLVAFGIGVDMKAMGLVESLVDEDEYRLERIPKGDLIVVLFDPRLGRVLWIGAADAELKDKPSADLVRKRLDHAITQMFEKARL